MSKKRYVDTKFWDDNYIIEKDPIEKLLFLYLLTNTLTNIIGIYEISIKRIAFDTGIDKDMVINILERFEKDEKIKYKNGWIVIRNFIKYQQDNPKIRAGISYELKKVPQSLLGFANILNYKPTEKKFKGQKVHKNLREKILEKYNHRCCFCGAVDNLEIDHIVPVFQGGTNEESNLRVLCQSCNGKRNAGLRWNKENNGWDIDSQPIKMGRLSHTNLNTNLNPNTNISKEIKEVRNQVSASLKEKSISKEKPEANNIEFDQELLSWHGVDEDIFDNWVKRFPDIDVSIELMKIREHFKNNPKKAKDIEKKFEGRMPIYINDWLERAVKYNKKEGV